MVKTSGGGRVWKKVERTWNRKGLCNGTDQRGGPGGQGETSEEIDNTVDGGCVRNWSLEWKGSSGKDHWFLGQPSQPGGNPPTPTTKEKRERCTRGKGYRLDGRLSRQSQPRTDQKESAEEVDFSRGFLKKKIRD